MRKAQKLGDHACKHFVSRCKNAKTFSTSDMSVDGFAALRATGLNLRPLVS